MRFSVIWLSRPLPSSPILHVAAHGRRGRGRGPTPDLAGPGPTFAATPKPESPKMPRKSIYRQPGARTYQLVHRSQRDPLIHDPDAPQHVLKEFERENVRKVRGVQITLSTRPQSTLCFC